MATSGDSKRRLNQTEKREALLDAAINLFRTRGVADTTVEEITQLAGVAKGTFYLYFQTKDVLVDELRVEFAQQIEAFFNAVRPPELITEWPEFIGHMVETAVDLMVEQGDLHDLIAALPHAHEAGALADGMARAHQSLSDILQGGATIGALDFVDADATAWLLFDLIHSAADRASTAPVNAGRFRRTCSGAAQRWLIRRSY